jgi:DNA-directed RNA polymerase subunit RPC12/RpoP
VKPRRPRVDREGEAEQHVRQLFKNEVDLWIKENIEGDAPSKEVRGTVVDNLTASFSSSIETLVAAATDSYLSTATEEDDDVIECPECEEEFETPEGKEVGDDVKCPKCGEKFEIPDFDDDDDDSEEGDAAG